MDAVSKPVPRVHMPSAKISVQLMTPRSPSPVGNLRISESQEIFEPNMSTQTAYSEHPAKPFWIFKEHKIYCTCVQWSFCSQVGNMAFPGSTRLSCSGQAWPTAWVHGTQWLKRPTLPPPSTNNKNTVARYNYSPVISSVPPLFLLLLFILHSHIEKETESMYIHLSA